MSLREGADENTLDFLEMARDAGDYKLPQRARGSLCLAGGASTPAYSHDGAGVVRFLRVVQRALAFSLTNDAMSNCPLGASQLHTVGLLWPRIRLALVWSFQG